MNLKIGDSVLYLSHMQQHTGIIIAIKAGPYPYEVHWINDQFTSEPEDEIQEYRKLYLEVLGK